MFGPLELRFGQNQGALLETPKPGWAGFPVCKYLATRLGIPMAIDTDVNAAVLGNSRFGAARGAGVALYITVGTGVGGGVLVGGEPLHELMHPELGHIPMPALLDASGHADSFDGNCPYHGRCLEGLISGPALLRRTGIKGENLPDEHTALDWAARYLGVGLASAVLMFSPEVIIVGGGVMAKETLLSKVRAAVLHCLGGYVSRVELTVDGIQKYVIAPGLGTRSGVSGAFVLAEQALAQTIR